jgi:hypothetical protein
MDQNRQTRPPPSWALTWTSRTSHRHRTRHRQRHRPTVSRRATASPPRARYGSLDRLTEELPVACDRVRRRRFRRAEGVHDRRRDVAPSMYWCTAVRALRRSADRPRTTSNLISRSTSPAGIDAVGGSAHDRRVRNAIVDRRQHARQPRQIVLRRFAPTKAALQSPASRWRSVSDPTASPTSSSTRSSMCRTRRLPPQA